MARITEDALSRGDVTPAMLREWIDCDPATGRMQWRHRDRRWFGSDRAWRTWNTRFEGKEAFTDRSVQGYLRSAIKDEKFLAHRVMWAICHGEWPRAEIDHLNGDRADNRLANLRAADRTRNMRNARRRSDNTSGVTGVRWRPGIRKWESRIRVGKRDVTLGYFEDLALAASIRRAAELEHGYGPNHGRPPPAADLLHDDLVERLTVTRPTEVS